MSALFTVYIVIIFVYILLNLVFSFGLRLPYSRWTDALLNFLRDVSEPYLRLFRRLLPTCRRLRLHADDRDHRPVHRAIADRQRDPRLTGRQRR